MNVHTSFIQIFLYIHIINKLISSLFMFKFIYTNIIYILYINYVQVLFWQASYSTPSPTNCYKAVS